MKKVLGLARVALITGALVMGTLAFSKTESRTDTRHLCEFGWIYPGFGAHFCDIGDWYRWGSIEDE